MDESQVFSEFESAWQQRRYKDIDRMLCASARRVDEAAELVMMDLEYRWRNPLSSADRGQALIPNCPRVEDYCRKIPVLETQPRRLLELIGEEYRVRLQWADPPQFEEFADRFPARRHPIELLIQKIRSEVPHLCVSIVLNNSEVISTPVYRTLEIGRQSITQPPPFCEIQTQAGRKLVIAALDNVKVSRSQLEIVHCATGVRLKNLSSKVGLKIGLVSRLQPSRTAEYRLPLAISIGELELRITR